MGFRTCCRLLSASPNYPRNSGQFAQGNLSRVPTALDDLTGNILNEDPAGMPALR